MFAPFCLAGEGLQRHDFTVPVVLTANGTPRSPVRDLGTGTDTVMGFTPGQDLIFFSGQNNSPGGTRDQVIAAQTHPTAASTVLAFPDGTMMTLVGITNVDQTFFK